VLSLDGNEPEELDLVHGYLFEFVLDLALAMDWHVFHEEVQILVRSATLSAHLSELLYDRDE
jgi:hypothetical protein